MFNPDVWKPALAAAGVIPMRTEGERGKVSRKEGFHVLPARPPAGADRGRAAGDGPFPQPRVTEPPFTFTLAGASPLVAGPFFTLPSVMSNLLP